MQHHSYQQPLPQHPQHEPQLLDSRSRIAEKQMAFHDQFKDRVASLLPHHAPNTRYDMHTSPHMDTRFAAPPPSSARTSGGNPAGTLQDQWNALAMQLEAMGLPQDMAPIGSAPYGNQTPHAQDGYSMPPPNAFRNAYVEQQQQQQQQQRPRGPHTNGGMPSGDVLSKLDWLIEQPSEPNAADISRLLEEAEEALMFEDRATHRRNEEPQPAQSVQNEPATHPGKQYQKVEFSDAGQSDAKPENDPLQNLAARWPAEHANLSALSASSVHGSEMEEWQRSYYTWLMHYYQAYYAWYNNVQAQQQQQQQQALSGEQTAPHTSEHAAERRHNSQSQPRRAMNNSNHAAHWTSDDSGRRSPLSTSDVESENSSRIEREMRELLRRSDARRAAKGSATQHTSARRGKHVSSAPRTRRDTSRHEGRRNDRMTGVRRRSTVENPEWNFDIEIERNSAPRPTPPPREESNDRRSRDSETEKLHSGRRHARPSHSVASQTESTDVVDPVPPPQPELASTARHSDPKETEKRAAPIHLPWLPPRSESLESAEPQPPPPRRREHPAVQETRRTPSAATTTATTASTRTTSVLPGNTRHHSHTSEPRHHSRPIGWLYRYSDDDDDEDKSDAWSGSVSGSSRSRSGSQYITGTLVAKGGRRAPGSSHHHGTRNNSQPPRTESTRKRNSSQSLSVYERQKRELERAKANPRWQY